MVFNASIEWLYTHKNLPEDRITDDAIYNLINASHLVLCVDIQIDISPKRMNFPR